MKIDVHSRFADGKRPGRPNIYMCLRPENETERALLLALYGVKPRFIPQDNGEHLFDFFPPGLDTSSR